MNLKEKAIHNNLVKVIKEKIKDAPVDILSQILHLSKESIYRRLRGEVLFTFYEAVLITQKLKISLDETLMIEGYYQLSNQSLEENQLDTQSYHHNISRWGELLKNYANHPKSNLYFTITDQVLPQMSTYNDLLIRFVYYHSLFENGGLIKNQIKFSEIEIPLDIIEDIKLASYSFAHLNTTCIINRNTFSSYLSKVEYLKRLELITEEETNEIKLNLYLSLEHIRNMCNTGYTLAGKRFETYICETNSGSSFGILEDDASSILFTQLLGLNHMRFKDPNIIKSYKHTFTNLKSLSTLISGSGSAQRIVFFNEQFAILDNL